MSDAINLEVWPTHHGSDSGAPPPTKKARWTVFLKGERDLVNEYLKSYMQEEAMNDLDPILEAKYCLTDEDLESLTRKGTTRDVYDADFHVM